MSQLLARKEAGWIRLGLVSQPGPICDATCATLARTPRLRLVAIAHGALSATQMLQRLELDLILLDANLPEDEVVALLHWLTDQEKTDQEKTVKILVATATSGLLHQALAFGADDAVRRDELPAKLANMVDALLHENP